MSQGSVEFGLRLYQLRCAAGLSAVNLARELRCSPSLIFAWESGRELPNLRQVKELARALRMSETDLLAVV